MQNMSAMSIVVPYVVNYSMETTPMNKATPTQQQKSVIEGTGVKFPVPEYVTDPGTFNKMPTPWIEVEGPEEVLGLLGMYGIQFTEFRQIMPYRGPKTYTDHYKGNPESKYHIDLQILWGVDMAVAYSRSHMEHYLEKGETKQRWTPIRWFRIGCIHEWKQTCDDGWVMTRQCQKCGLIMGDAYK